MFKQKAPHVEGLVLSAANTGDMTRATSLDPEGVADILLAALMCFGYYAT